MIKENTPRTILAFLLGAAAGAAAALLFAPKAGEELRNDIAEAVNDGVNQVSSQGKRIKAPSRKISGPCTGSGAGSNSSRRERI